MNKDFWLGLAVGMVIALSVSLGIFYYVVIQRIESTKTEIRDNIQEVRDAWKSEFKGKLEQAAEVIEAHKGTILNRVKDRLQSQKDSTSTTSEIPEK